MSIFIEPDFTSCYEADPLVLVDVGASGGPKRNWDAAKPYLRVIGFDADERAQAGSTNVFLNVGLFRQKGSLTFYQTRKQTGSSVFKPNRALLDRFIGTGRFDVVGTKTVEVDTLDSQLRQHDVTDVDFIKLDTQGSELSILEGAAETLRSQVFGLEVEVEFAELYEGQPLFADVDKAVRPLGFQLFDLKPTYWKRAAGREWGKRKGQLICGDALYLRGSDQLEAILRGRDDQKRQAKIMRALSVCFLYGYFDFAREIFEQERRVFDDGQARAIDEKIQSARSLSSRIPIFRGRQRIANLLARLHEIVEPTFESGVTGPRYLGNV